MAKPRYHCAELMPDSSGLHTPSHYSKRKEQRQEHERDRDKVGGLKKKERKWCSCAFQRLFQSSVTRFNLFLIRQGHSPHIFQTPHCYQIQFCGQLFSLKSPLCYLHLHLCTSPEASLWTKEQKKCSKINFLYLATIHMDAIKLVHLIILV